MYTWFAERVIIMSIKSVIFGEEMSNSVGFIVEKVGGVCIFIMVGLCAHFCIGFVCRGVCANFCLGRHFVL